VNLDGLGARVCVLGPSNSGKSTLASAIGHARGVPVVHLDQYRFLPGTAWRMRPDDEFAALHDSAVRQERWVIDGNYSKLLPPRLARATGVILLDASAGASLVRYVKRTWSSEDRVGGLDGSTERLSWEMFRFILTAAQTNRRRNRNLFDELALPKIIIPNRRTLERFYLQENLALHK
jgi:adenylate kinase family enzyme